MPNGCACASASVSACAWAIGATSRSVRISRPCTRSRSPTIFASLVPWLMLNHGGLSILIHPNTTNPKRDHLVDPIWIGRALAVKGEVLGEEDDAEEALEVNTQPTVTA